MTWMHLFALLVGGLAVIPLSMAFTYVAHRRRLNRARLAVEAAIPDAHPVPAPEPAMTDWDEASVRHHARNRTRERVLVSTADSTYEYTIRRHHGALKQQVADLGGFSRIPLLLYDRRGNCVLVHRKVSLN